MYGFASVERGIRAMTPPPADDSERTSGRAGLRVLIAEDDPNSRKVLTAALERMRPQLTITANGREAVDAFQRQPFDVVLMDLQMPVMDGYAATREIRALESQRQSSRTPIVVVSAHTRPGSWSRPGAPARTTTWASRSMSPRCSAPSRRPSRRCSSRAASAGTS
jgi:CheY-like chemotaxis protein